MDDKSTPSEDDSLHGQLLTVSEVAAYLRVSRVTVWRWCQRGVIPAFQIGRTWRIRRADLLQLETRPFGKDDTIPPS
ncbi:MAG: helix-turn-helix domain-containing protein [Anaerolineae bacterium]